MKDTITDNSNMMNLNEVADYLKVHPSTIYRMVRRKLIPFFKIGSDYRFLRETIDEWIKTEHINHSNNSKI